MKLYTLDPSKDYLGTPILINNPEQLVPIDIARWVPKVFSSVRYGIPLPTAFVRNKSSKSSLKRLLLLQLNYPYPKHYYNVRNNDSIGCSLVSTVNKTWTSTNLKFPGLSYKSNLNGWTSHNLVLVRAKWLPYIRARLVLDLPLRIPMDDLNVLHTNEGILVLNIFCKREGIKPQLVTQSTIDRYLSHQIQTKSTEEYIKDVISLHKGTTKFAPTFVT